MDEKHLQHLFYLTPYGRMVTQCIQCGSCTGSCPLANCMDHGPRELFAMIREGEMNEVLGSNTPWYCVSCYQCVVRCPREIPVTDLMYSIKQMAEKYKYTDHTHKLPDLYHAFIKVVQRHGRITEPIVMARYGVRHLSAAILNIPLGLKLLKKNRLEVLPQHIRQPKNIMELLSDDIPGDNE